MMQTLGKRTPLSLLAWRKALPLMHRHRCGFSSDKKEDGGKSGKKAGEVSLMSIWEWASSKGQRVYNDAKKLTPWQWGILASVPLLWWLLREEEAQEYPINSL